MMRMKIIIVDDERRSLRVLNDTVASVCPEDDVTCFSSAHEALAFSEMNKVDTAFLDIKMPEMHGIKLAGELKKANPKTNVIFVTGYSEYAREAFSVRASGYLLKPALAADVKRELDNLRYPLEPRLGRIRVQCFGNFEVFVDDEPLSFPRSRAKEILAYLVDRNGASISKREIAAVLWEDEEYTRSKQVQLQTLFSELRKKLASVGAQELLIKEHGFYAVNKKCFYCDYYEFLKGNTYAINSYQGEYMTNYSWAEFTISQLN